MDKAIKQTWIHDGYGRLLAVAGEITITSEVVGGEVVVTIKQPVLYRRGAHRNKKDIVTNELRRKQ